jgi:flagellar motility protein MotE (MotC chaperone)
MKIRLRILPLVMVFATVGFTFKAGNVFTDVSQLVQRAQAQEAANPAEGSAAAAAKAGDQQPTEAPQQSLVVSDPLLMSRSELDLLQDLANRRQQLDGREEQIDMREKLLTATEQRIDGKIVRLESLVTEIGELVRAHEEQENAQLRSIVKVYENMKPKSAAKIFERLDMDIQIDVAMRMKEVKMAPIMAAMSQEGARKLTVALAIRAKLPPLEG